jgi:hypothetical protein
MTAEGTRAPRIYDLFKTLVAVVLLIVVLVSLYTERSETEDETRGTETAQLQTAVMGMPVLGTDGSISIDGEGEPGSQIRVVANGEELGTVMVGADGAWSFSGTLEPGTYTMTAETIDDDGAVVNSSEAVAVTIPEPESVIVVPELAEPTVGEAGEFTLSGTAEPGHTIEILANGVSLGTAAVAEDGTWTYSGQLEAGEYDVVVRTLDEDGTVINESGEVALTISGAEEATATPETLVPETATPEATETTTPEIAAPEVSPPQLSDEGQLSLSGTGEPGQTVEVWDGDVSLGTATVSEDGSWSMEADLEPGEHKITVQTVDADGQVINQSQEVLVEVPEPVVEIEQPSVSSPEFDDTGGFSISGTGEPGSTLELWVGGTELGSVVVGDDGTWSYSGELDPGTYVLVARTVDGTGEVVNESDRISFEVAAPVVAQAPTVGEPVISASGTVTVSGTGEPGAMIEIVEDGAVIGTVEVASDGTWDFVYTAAEGEHTLAIQNQGEAEGVGASVTIEVLAQAPAEGEEATGPEESHETGAQVYIVVPDDWLRQLARRFYGDATKWTLIYEGTNAKAREDPSFAVISNPDLLRPGWKLWIPEQ